MAIPAGETSHGNLGVLWLKDLKLTFKLKNFAGNSDILLLLYPEITAGEGNT